MPDNERFSDRELERDLRDLSARIEYPPTPDLAQAVRRLIDEEDAGQPARRGRFWPSFLTPRWAMPAAALVLIAVAVFSPEVRGTLSDPIVSEDVSSSEQQADAGGLDTKYVRLTMPSFDLETDLDLKERLRAMGMTRPFEDADFSGITGGRTCTSPTPGTGQTSR